MLYPEQRTDLQFPHANPPKLPIYLKFILYFQREYTGKGDVVFRILLFKDVKCDIVKNKQDAERDRTVKNGFPGHN
jgi:hypothetical protein